MKRDPNLDYLICKCGVVGKIGIVGKWVHLRGAYICNTCREVMICESLPFHKG